MSPTSSSFGLIYFVTDGEAIKIGFTKNVAKRVLALQTSHHFPLFLLGSIPASRHEETILHQRFSHLRLKGEWFKVSPEITDYINELDHSKQLIEGDREEAFLRKLGLEGQIQNVMTDHD